MNISARVMVDNDVESHYFDYFLLGRAAARRSFACFLSGATPSDATSLSLTEHWQKVLVAIWKSTTSEKSAPVLVDMGTFSLHSACWLSRMQIIRYSRPESSFQTVIIFSATHRQDTKLYSSYVKLHRGQRNSFVERRFLIRTWGRIKNLWRCYIADRCKLGRNGKTWLDEWYSNAFPVNAFWRRWAINKSNQVPPRMKTYM